jgi:hypothetical protein
MKIFGRELVGFAKALVVLIAVLLVAAGMCGLQLAIGNGSSGNSDAVFEPLGILELIAMLVSAVGIVVVLLAWGARGLYRLSLAESKSEAEETSRNRDRTENDK